MTGVAGVVQEKRSNGLLVAAVLVVLSLVTVYLPTGTQQAIGHSLRQSVLKPFIATNAALVRARARARDFEVLRAQMDSATGLIAAQRTLAEENRQLRDILSLQARPGTSYTPTTIIRPGTSGSASVFIVGAGSTDGVRSFSAVVTDGGLLGQILQVQPDYSLAIDWSHPAFRAAAMTPDAENHGIVEAEQGQFREQDRLVLRGVHFLSDVEPGTEILTSGRGGAFPRGIRIGWVGELAASSAGWSRSFYITPSVYPGAVTYAAIANRAAIDSVATVAGAPVDSSAALPR